MLRQTLVDPTFISAHRQCPQDFTRDQALPFATVISWLLINFQNLMRQSLQRLQDGRPSTKIIAATKGALTQAPAKLKPSALIVLNLTSSQTFHAQGISCFLTRGWLN